MFSIHQPCYFPWLGLLHKIAKSDTLIVLDEVQLSDSAYQHRNQFLTMDGKVKYLTIPFIKHNYLALPFKELKIANETWAGDHKNFLLSNYKKHPYFDQIYPQIESILTSRSPYLIDAVMDSMRTSISLFGLSTQIIMQSQLNYDRSAKKGDLVIQLLKASKVNEYLSGHGALCYQDNAAFESEGIVLNYTDFTHPAYPQKNSLEFISGLSCLDLLFNVGIEQGRSLLQRSNNQ